MADCVLQTHLSCIGPPLPPPTLTRIHYVSYHKPLRRTHTSAAAEHGANPESHGSAPARAEHRGSATGAVCAMESGRKVVRIEEDDALGH